MSENHSISKVMLAGFRVFRVHPQMKKITYAKGPGQWCTFSTFKSEAETIKAFKLLMQDDKNISM